MSHNDAIQTLMNSGLEFARTQLQEHGEFYPFGMSLTPQGEVSPAEPHRGDDDPSPQQLIAALEEQLRVQADCGLARAAAIFVKVMVGGEAGSLDAIQVSMEHEAGFCSNIIVPYSTSGDEITLGQPFATEREATVFC